MKCFENLKIQSALYEGIVLDYGKYSLDSIKTITPVEWTHKT